MSERLRIDREDFHMLAANWIRERYETPEVAASLCKFIDPSANLLQRITTTLAVAIASRLRGLSAMTSRPARTGRR